MHHIVVGIELIPYDLLFIQYAVEVLIDKLFTIFLHLGEDVWKLLRVLKKLGADCFECVLFAEVVGGPYCIERCSLLVLEIAAHVLIAH